MSDHDKLIDALAAHAGPIRRVSPVWVRSAILIPLMIVLGFAATTALHQTAGGWSVPANAAGIANAALCLLIGAIGLVQALALSIPGRGFGGKSLTMAALAAWLAIAATSINTVPAIASATVPGERLFCFAFLLVAGLPMVAVVILALRRTRSLRPMPSLIAAGCSVAFLSFGLLAFCHPVEIWVGDFATHIMAALVLGLLTVAIGHKAVAA